MNSEILAFLVRLITGVRLDGRMVPSDRQRVFFANHSSHLDFIVIWAALPAAARRRVRPVAAAEYWEKGPLRRWLAGRVFRAVLIPRNPARMRERNPLALMGEALEGGADLIVFPEGTRGESGAVAPFKSGLHHLATDRPGLELIPVYLENLSRILPKGELLPVPLMGNVIFGPVVEPPAGDESRDAFLQRARQSILRLAGDTLTDTATSAAHE